MQIRTPKKYQGIQRRSILGCRRMSFYLLMIALIAIGIGIFLNRETLAPVVQETLLQIIEELEGRAATMAAPLPTPTHDPQNTLLEADNYWQGGSLGEAALLYMDIAESMPNTVEVFRRIAIGLINASRYDEAADYAERAINADPYDAQAWAIRAWALDWQARPAEALSSALHALELDPDNSRAGAYLAEIYFNLGQPERGEALLAELLENDPNSPEAYRARGLIKQEYRYDFDGAIEDYKSAYSMANHMNLYATDIAVIEIGLRNFATAEDYVQQVIEVEPFNARALFNLGQIKLSGEGNPAQAQRYLQDCVDFNPTYFHCYYLLGRSQDRLGALPDAAISFEKAIELGSQLPQHYYWAGYAQIELGDCQRALAYLDTGRRIALQRGATRYLADIEAIISECDSSFVSGSPAG